MTRITPTVIVVSSVLQREGIASLLQGTPYKVVAAVGWPNELTDHDVTKEGRALAIVGIDSESGSPDKPVESVRQLRSLIPDCKVVLIAEANGPFDLRSLMALAADGYILDLDSRDMLLKSLELISGDRQIFVLGHSCAALPKGRDDAQFPDRAARSQSGSSYELAKKAHNIQLSCREREVLTCLARGGSNKGIARLCHISEATVKVHLKAILRKINARNRTQAAIWAIEHGLRDFSLEQITPAHHADVSAVACL